MPTTLISKMQYVHVDQCRAFLHVTRVQSRDAVVHKRNTFHSERIAGCAIVEPPPIHEISIKDADKRVSVALIWWARVFAPFKANSLRANVFLLPLLRRWELCSLFVSALRMN